MNEKYQEQLNKYKEALKAEEKKFNVLGYLKLLSAIILIALIYFGFIYDFEKYKMTAIICITVINIGLWIFQSYVKNSIDHLKGLIRITEQYLSRIDGSWTAFTDNGAEFADYNHPYTHDLDVFGVKSIFQFLNVTKSYHGRRRFKDDLSDPRYERQQILDRQEAIKELAANSEFSHEYQYNSNDISGSESIKELIEGLNKENKSADIPAGGFTVLSLLRYMPLLVITIIILINILKFPQNYIVTLILLGAQLLIWAFSSYKINKELDFADKIKYELSKYSKLFKLIESQKFESRLMLQIQYNISKGESCASAAIKKLNMIVSMIKVRHNGLLYFIFNILFLWDLNCKFILQKWKSKFVPHFDEWFENLGTVESLLSFSVLENVVSNISYPEPLDINNLKNTKQIHAKNIGHPLLANGKRVCNDFDLNNNISVISGSNMSGKTTFLRTVGLNLLLAKCGAGVCADLMLFSDFHIITSMRISDDLNEGISTFYAELKKIKAIINMAEENENTIFFIDEIFKGTNSEDRTAGAKAVIRTLYKSKICGFITTHDLELCHNTDFSDVSNWHFQEQYNNDVLSFDYKIKPGVAVSTNGRYLMKMIGILK